MTVPGTARAAVLEDIERIRVRPIDIPRVGPDDALLRIEMVGICGTDVKYYKGKLSAPLPIILGHEILGRVADIGPSAARRYHLQPGDRVTVEGPVPCWACQACFTGNYRFCESKRSYGTRTPITEPPGLWGAMAEYMYLAPGSVAHLASDKIPARAAIIAGLVGNAIQWVRTRGGVTIGDTVLVQGAGPQGLVAAAVAREAGAGTVIVTGLAHDVARLGLAKAMGADATIIADQEDVVERVNDITGGRLPDVVLDVTGSPEAFGSSVQLVRRQGTVVLAGLAGRGRTAPLELDNLVWKEIRIQGVYTKGADAVAAGIRFLEYRADRYPIDQIVSHVFSLDEAEDAIHAAERGGEQFTKAAIAP